MVTIDESSQPPLQVSGWIFSYIFEYFRIFLNTPIRGLSTIFEKSSWDLVYPDEFSMREEFWKIWLVVLGEWKL